MVTITRGSATLALWDSSAKVARGYRPDCNPVARQRGRRQVALLADVPVR